MQIIEKKLSELTPYGKNPRKNDGAVDAVAASISEFGFKVPIVIDRDGVIVAGHTRLKAAKKLKMETVPCVVADDLTEEQVRAFRLADNRTAELAEWDFSALADELAGIADINMEDFGFEMPDMDVGGESGGEESDNYEEPPEGEPARSKLGEIYQLGNHRLMCGDCTDASSVARLMDGEKADLVFTDPPYNVAIGNKNAVLNKLNHDTPGHRIEKNIENDAGMTDEQLGKVLWLPAFKNMRDNADDACSIYVTMPQGGAHMMMMMMMGQGAGWQVKHELIWLKNQPTFSMGRLNYDYKHEPIMFGWNKSHKFYGKGEFDKSVWEIDKPAKSDLHPTMKPVRLVVNCLRNSSQAGDVVLDLFGGSGTTLIACEQEGRKCCMMELDPHYVDVIIKRWEDYTGRKSERIS